MVPYKCTNPPRSLGHIAQALFCLVRFGRCSGALHLFDTEARFQMLHVSHCQDATHTVQWPLQLKCKDLWSIRPHKPYCIYGDVPLQLRHSLYFGFEWWRCQGKKHLRSSVVLLLPDADSSLWGLPARERKKCLTWLFHPTFHNKDLCFSLVILALCPESNVSVPSTYLSLPTIKPWILFSFLPRALSLPDDASSHTPADCFQTSF